MIGVVIDKSKTIFSGLVLKSNGYFAARIFKTLTCKPRANRMVSLWRFPVYPHAPRLSPALKDKIGRTDFVLAIKKHTRPKQLTSSPFKTAGLDSNGERNLLGTIEFFDG